MSDEEQLSGMNDEEHLAWLVERYMLDAIGRLSTAEAKALAAGAAELSALYGGDGSWQSAIANAFELTPTLTSRLRAAWKSAGPVADPEAFVQDFVASEITIDPTLGDIEDEMDDRVYQQIEALCEAGDDLVDDGKFEPAIVEYRKAWDLVPDPKEIWPASVFVLAALGDALHLAGKLPEALDAFAKAVEINGEGNPFLHLRHGQLLFDAGRKDEAAGELLRAFEIEGEAIFDAAEDRPYLDFLKTRMRSS